MWEINVKIVDQLDLYIEDQYIYLAPYFYYFTEVKLSYLIFIPNPK